ncbi:hypothetical protein MA16_Dca002027 [Dendrobium catenatum]|uniref:Uncharacterized protein n=1 Tax=Dendrobium catenatum TaxID=906689 RepID=A0A2I0XE56_9ASPA|nr:hypothetical protein MA16_Dca002027 [Dendrobium catenatum]
MVPPSFLIPPSLISQVPLRRNTTEQPYVPHSVPNFAAPSLSHTGAASLSTPTQIDTNSQNHLAARHPMITRTQSGYLKPTNRLNLLHTTNSTSDPTSYNAANKLPEWRNAMAAEFLALQKQET